MSRWDAAPVSNIREQRSDARHRKHRNKKLSQTCKSLGTVDTTQQESRCSEDLQKLVDLVCERTEEGTKSETSILRVKMFTEMTTA
jgi:hypothetical protein